MKSTHNRPPADAMMTTKEREVLRRQEQEWQHWTAGPASKAYVWRNESIRQALASAINNPDLDRYTENGAELSPWAYGEVFSLPAADAWERFGVIHRSLPEIMKEKQKIDLEHE